MSTIAEKLRANRERYGRKLEDVRNDTDLTAEEMLERQREGVERIIPPPDTERLMPGPVLY